MILQMADPVKELKEIRFTSEKEMQHFCEKNMEQMLGLQFIASEFRVAQFRFDSVAYNPVRINKKNKQTQIKRFTINTSRIV